MKKILLFLLIIISISAQVENVPIDHGVYTFLKEMQVKKIITSLHEDVPNLRYGEVKEFLKTIESKQNQLSNTEKALLDKYRIEFFYDEMNEDNTWLMFGKSPNLFTSPFTVFDDKQKFLYKYQQDENNLFVEMLGTFNYGHRLQPSTNNAELYDIGFRFRGSLFEHLGYNLTIVKGGVSGSRDFARIVDPRLNYNFKFNENIENISNYDFAEGYLQYQTNPADNMDLLFQIGREKMTLGYGYGSKLVMSGDHPYFDFLKVRFKYGIVEFTSVHASTVGEFSLELDERFTKYYAMNRFNFTFEDFADFGIGEVIVYSGRGIELAYLNPLLFYKFAEMSLQDRDNGLVFLDFKTNAIKNIEFHGTFFLDENILGHLQHMSRFSNKTAYQLGGMWYEAFGLSDLSLALEYTKIRPYVYSHRTMTDSYTSYGEIIGHRIGPNADEIFAETSYNLNEWIRPSLSFSYIRSGENFVSENGVLIKNVGGNVFEPFRDGVDSQNAVFLDGNRINSTEIIIGTRIEPIRDFIFDLSYNYISQDHVDEGFSADLSYLELIMKLQF